MEEADPIKGLPQNITRPSPEVRSAEKEKQDLLESIEQDLKKEQLAGLKQDRFLRWVYAFAIPVVVTLCVIAVFVILFLQGFWGRDRFTLPDSVLVTLVTGMIASVIGLLAIVATYLFPKR